MTMRILNGWDDLHDRDMKENPERHFLYKESYSRDEMLDMCHKCYHYQEWNKQLQYDARTDLLNKVRRD